MAGLPTITVIGTLTADPELRFTANGAAVASFSIAVNERTLDKTTNQWVDGDASFYRCSAWREYAENVAESLRKGMRVIVVGDQKITRYTGRDGVERTSVDIEIEAVGPDLRWATAEVTRKTSGQRQGGQRQSQPQGQPQGQQQVSNDPWSQAPAQQPAQRQQAPADPWSQAPGGDAPF